MNKIYQVKMYLSRGKATLTKDGKYILKWHDGTNKIIECDSLVYSCYGLNEALISSQIIYKLNIDSIYELCIRNYV